MSFTCHCHNPFPLQSLSYCSQCKHQVNMNICITDQVTEPNPTWLGLGSARCLVHVTCLYRWLVTDAQLRHIAGDRLYRAHTAFISIIVWQQSSWMIRQLNILNICCSWTIHYQTAHAACICVHGWTWRYIRLISLFLMHWLQSSSIQLGDCAHVLSVHATKATTNQHGDNNQPRKAMLATLSGWLHINTVQCQAVSQYFLCHSNDSALFLYEPLALRWTPQ